MLNVLELKSKIVLAGMTNSQVAKLLGITPASFYKKLRCENEFSRAQIQVLVKALDIQDIANIFFKEEVS